MGNSQFYNKRKTWLTYEEVNNADTRSIPLQTEEGLELQWEQHYNDEGRYTLDMVKIDNKIKEVINHIKMAEAKEASHISKIEDAAPQVSVAT
jgi:hypothetical protein